ncbi:MAG: Aminobenzoyl-glutamate utilization protein B [Cytophagales bacterium]|jgi:aminobenzoyl-glutamate utilization protein B|nr:amidohydrolase [Bacteroidota bacterium]MBS1979533.1 amidohydrolase [Bacteroidota bacterium]WHZ09268.1 MAG: Aminobenzoyl-glutamate utilization protein B [Cytophagales bacterium]
MKSTVLAFLVSAISFLAFSQLKVKGEKDKQFVAQELDRKFSKSCTIAKQIWSWAEMGYLEQKSSALHQETLKSAGFSIQTGVADIPTAFVATYGSGKPVIGILAEFDALPGLSQDSVPYKKPIREGAPGHGCGHNLFGTASVTAAIAIKDWLVKNNRSGTIKVFGTPAEEGGGGKTYMVKAGLFNGIDAVLHWHPGNSNQANPESCLANISGRFRFHGVAAHAAANPDAGKSALDAVESMDYMVNLMREHVPQESRIHYVITKGGLTSNVVPDFAEVEYTVRHPDVTMTKKIWARVVKCADAAAMGTETTMDYELESGLYNLLPNETLSKIMHDNLTMVGGVKYTPAEIEFAQTLQTSFTGKKPDVRDAATVEPYRTGVFFPASTDVGNISWVVPTVGLSTATWVPGTPAHSWQSTSTGAMGIGLKAMLNASKTIAMTGVDLFNNPTAIDAAKTELNNRRGGDFKYESLVGDRKPPLDYRKDQVK